MIDIRDLTVSYGGASVLEGCSLRVERGESVALMGPSGCGKTTLLGCAAGLVRPQSGSVRLGTKRIACVFQEPRLLPWLTAAQNVNVVLSDSAATMPLALGLLRRAGLERDADKYPRELSGGMQQRVAICRALAYGGEALLLDEPLKGLNAGLREEIAALIREESAGKAVLLATHDDWEARTLAGRVLRCEGKKFV